VSDLASNEQLRDAICYYGYEDFTPRGIIIFESELPRNAKFTAKNSLNSLAFYKQKLPVIKLQRIKYLKYFENSIMYKTLK